MKLTATNIEKSYKGRKVVKGISVEVSQGEIVGLLGPNGAGKTTSFYMIVGLIKPNNGAIFLDDKEITMKIPVQLTGTSPGVLNGGSLRFTNRKLRVKALPANLPDFVTADISALKIGSKLVVASLANEGYTFMHPDNTVVVQVRTSRNATDDAEDEEAEAAEAAAPAAE